MELNTSAFTVVVANDDADGLQAKALANNWHSDGLLGEFAWVTPEDVTTAAYGPATVMTTVFGRDEQVELMTLLGARPRSLIRIVVLHLLTHENSSAERLVEACNQISDLVGRAMPRQLHDGGGQRGMRLLRVNLLVPESDLLPQSTTLIERGWEVNAIVSPEDRPDLDRMSVFVRQSVNLHGHGLAATAAVGGLWADSAVGSFDGHKVDSTSGGGELVVIRCQARVVVGDDRDQELAAQIAETVQSSHSGATTMLTWGAPADNAQAIARDSVEKLLASPEWAPQQRISEPLEKAQVPLGVIVRNWAIFQLQMPMAAFRFLFGIGRSMVEEAITAATVGRGAGEVGRVRPLSPDEVREVAEFRMKSLSAEVNPERLRDEASRWGQATPTAWRELRELAIGLVDGSRLPDRFSRTTRAGLDEVLKPIEIVPPPTDSLTLPGRPTIGSIDVERVAEIAHEQTQAEADAAAATAEQGKSPALGDPSAAGEETEIEPTESDHLAAWVEQRKPSMLWQLATRVYEFRRTELSQAQAAEEDLTSTSPPSTARLKTAQVVVIACWLLTLLGSAVIGAWAWAAARQDTWAFLAHLPEIDWETIGKIVLGILLALLVAGTLYFQALRAYEWQVMRQMHRIRQAGDEYVAARQQEKRWALMYRGIQEWGAILGELLHRPWMTAPEADDHLGTYDGLPAAVAVAVPVGINAEPDPRVVTRGVEVVCQRGWLLEEFDRIVAASPSNDPAAQPHAGHLPADLDLGLRARGPRQELIDVAAAPATKSAATRHLQEEVTDFVRHGDVRMPPQTVVRIGPYSAGDQVVDREFFGASNHVESPLTAELFHPTALVERYNIPERIVFSLPMGLSAPDLRQAEVHHCGVSVSTRVDVSPPVQPHNITLFVRAERAEATSITSGGEFN